MVRGRFKHLLSLRELNLFNEEHGLLLREPEELREAFRQHRGSLSEDNFKSFYAKVLALAESAKTHEGLAALLDEVEKLGVSDANAKGLQDLAGELSKMHSDLQAADLSAETVALKNSGLLKKVTEALKPVHGSEGLADSLNEFKEAEVNESARLEKPTGLGLKKIFNEFLNAHGGEDDDE